MGAEAVCRARSGAQSGEGKAHLDTDFVLFRGDFRVKIMLADLQSVEAAEGWLQLRSADCDLALELGRAAWRWADRITNPPGLMDKLGIKPGLLVSAAGIDDADFVHQLKVRLGEAAGAASLAEADVILLKADDRRELARVTQIRAVMKPAAALWLVTPRGKSAVTEHDALAAGRDAGLKDVKVCRFSPTHTAHRFVIPRSAL